MAIYENIFSGSLDVGVFLEKAPSSFFAFQTTL